MLAPRTEITELADRFRLQRRVRVNDLLTPEFAQQLFDCVSSWPEWNLVTRISGQHRAFDAAAMQMLSEAKQSEFKSLVHAEARNGFQYLYERFPLYDRARSGELGSSPLAEAFALLRSSRFLDLLRGLSGRPDISYTDAQLTRYRTGHFLTTHDDSDPAAGRVLAFVLNLTPAWCADFGGLLQFHGPDQEVAETFVPRFNSLSVFEVPAPHSVSPVAAFVESSRYAITGWARFGDEPSA